MLNDKRRKCILHIASWYPSPWNKTEGSFVKDQIRLFCEEVPGKAVVAQVLYEPRKFLYYRKIRIESEVSGHYVYTWLKPEGRAGLVLSTLLILIVLIQERAWRYKILHFHIAIPNLVWCNLWRFALGRTKIIISEHWSAYHYNFYLLSEAKVLARLRTPFEQGFPVLCVSKSLLKDIRSFARYRQFPGYVLPNIVPLHGATIKCNEKPVFFVANRWVLIKNPIPMLQGLAMALDDGLEFTVIIGGDGPLISEMKEVIQSSSLYKCCKLNGWMSKEKIAATLAVADGYLFNSLYETFSVACAEALGAGVPLIGPSIPAIAEYADYHNWEKIIESSPIGWRRGIERFINKYSKGKFRPEEIALKAANKFNRSSIGSNYKKIVNTLLN